MSSVASGIINNKENLTKEHSEITENAVREMSKHGIVTVGDFSCGDITWISLDCILAEYQICVYLTHNLFLTDHVLQDR